MIIRLLIVFVLCTVSMGAWIPAVCAGDSASVATTPFPSYTGDGQGAQEDPEPAPVLEMSLADAVFLALRHNRNVKSAYMNRVVQKFSLELSEHEFKPDFSVTGSVTHTESKSKTLSQEQLGNDNTQSESKGDSTSLAGTVTQKVPTGGNFSFSWTHSPSDTFAKTGDNESRTAASGNTWAVSFTQPLLEGAGWDYDMASLRTARNNENTNILNLKSSLISTVSQTISAYRSFLQASRQIEISKASLERAKKLYEVNTELIKAGRMAAMDIVQTEADVARQEVSYENALNSLDNSRLTLLQVLDIDKRTKVVPTEGIVIEPIEPNYAYCLEVAFANKPGWLTAKIGIDNAKMSLMQAERDRLPNLSLSSGYTHTDTRNLHSADAFSNAWNAGLSLSMPLYGDGALGKRNTYYSAKTSLRVAELNLEEQKDNIEIDVKNAVRNVYSQLKQARLATRARELSEQKLAVEREKLHLGLTSNFQLVTYLNDLVNSQESEISAQIAYLNALTTLDQLLGTTLDTWKIEFRDERPDVEREILDD